jgi:hypothetical protein
MEKKASLRQIVYLNYLLRNEGKVLSDITSKHYEELTYYDVKTLYYQLNVPLSIDLRNFEYIIKEETDDYIIGHQFNKQTKEKIMDIISFNSMMVLDYDIKKDNDDDNDHDTKKQILLKYIIDKLSEYPYTFYIYETFNGYHVYCTSKFFDYKKHSTHTLMKKLGCDQFYIGFTRYTGFVVRLNKKKDRREKYIERFVAKMGNEPDINILLDLLRLKDRLLENI